MDLVMIMIMSMVICRLSAAVCSGVPSGEVGDQHGSSAEGAVGGGDPHPGHLHRPLPGGRPRHLRYTYDHQPYLVSRRIGHCYGVY